MLLHALPASCSNFTGSLSSNTSKLKCLKHDDTSNTQFYGAIVSLSIGMLPFLENLDLNCNNFEGFVNACRTFLSSREASRMWVNDQMP